MGKLSVVPARTLVPSVDGAGKRDNGTTGRRDNGTTDHRTAGPQDYGTTDNRTARPLIYCHKSRKKRKNTPSPDFSQEVTERTWRARVSAGRPLAGRRAQSPQSFSFSYSFSFSEF